MPLGALSQSWVIAEACLPRDWRITGLLRFDDEWVAMAEGPTGDHLDGSGRSVDHALRCLGDRLRARRGSLTG